MWGDQSSLKGNKYGVKGGGGGLEIIDRALEGDKADFIVTQ